VALVARDLAPPLPASAISASATAIGTARKFGLINAIPASTRHRITTCLQRADARNESHAVAVGFNSHHVLEYVNASGRDLGAAPLHANLPTLVYAGTPQGAWPFSRAAQSAAAVASQLPKAFASQVAQVSEDAKGNVTLKMESPVSFLLGPATGLHAKFVAIASVILHTTLGVGDVVNVTVPDELAVSGPAPSQ